MTSNQDLNDLLRLDDEGSRAERCNRLSMVVAEFGSSKDIQLFHGHMSKRFFEEARWCFVNGQFIACVQLCQCFLENSLRNKISSKGPATPDNNKWLERAGFFDLIEKARDLDLLDSEDAEELHRLRKKRIQYIHAKPFFSGEHFMRRAMREEKDEYSMYEEDATHAIRLILNMNRKPLLTGL